MILFNSEVYIGTTQIYDNIYDNTSIFFKRALSQSDLLSQVSSITYTRREHQAARFNERIRYPADVASGSDRRFRGSPVHTKAKINSALAEVSADTRMGQQAAAAQLLFIIQPPSARVYSTGQSVDDDDADINDDCTINEGNECHEWLGCACALGRPAGNELAKASMIPASSS